MPGFDKKYKIYFALACVILCVLKPVSVLGNHPNRYFEMFMSKIDF